jgi:hypothetical protein
LQVQVYEPWVSVHVAFVLQVLPPPAAHSLMFAQFLPSPLELE